MLHKYLNHEKQWTYKHRLNIRNRFVFIILEITPEIVYWFKLHKLCTSSNSTESKCLTANTCTVHSVYGTNVHGNISYRQNAQNFILAHSMSHNIIIKTSIHIISIIRTVIVL